MTGQISDSITWQRQQYTIVGVDGGELFDPARHGMEPVMWHTACYRGFVCRYGLRPTGLFLNHLEIVVEAGPPPKLVRAEPRVIDERGRYEFQRINLRIAFEGRLLLGRDFAPERYQHMGFQDWSAYRVVLEATVTGSSVVVADRSPEEQSTTPPEDPDDLITWIDRRFELDRDARDWP